MRGRPGRAALWAERKARRDLVAERRRGSSGRSGTPANSGGGCRGGHLSVGDGAAVIVGPNWGLMYTGLICCNFSLPHHLIVPLVCAIFFASLVLFCDVTKGEFGVCRK